LFFASPHILFAIFLIKKKFPQSKTLFVILLIMHLILLFNTLIPSTVKEPRPPCFWWEFCILLAYCFVVVFCYWLGLHGLKRLTAAESKSE
jgi:uncharacterized membrane protein YesL